MEKIDADGFRRVVLYDGKREHDIAFQGRKIGGSQKAGAWLTPKGTIAVYDHREQELYTYDEYGAFADDEGVDERLRADVAATLAEFVDAGADATGVLCEPSCERATAAAPAPPPASAAAATATANVFAFLGMSVVPFGSFSTLMRPHGARRQLRRT